MFLSLFKQNNPIGKQSISCADDLYEKALLQTRKPIFYEEYKVPDRFDGRFDLLVLHVFIFVTSLNDTKEGQKLAQDLFDVTFKNMDQTLREMGIGDMGIPKHMKKMMKAFNGRMHSYQWTIDPSKITNKDEIEGFVWPENLEEALQRNLYGSAESEDEILPKVLKSMAEYVHRNIEHLREKDVSQYSFSI